MHIPIPKGVQISTIEIELTQVSDACAPDDLGQDIRMSVIDGGGGPYLVISTERWAMDSPDDLEPTLRALMEMVEMVESGDVNCP